MLLPSSLGSIALVLYMLCGAALSHRLPKELQKKDLICEQDDMLQSFQQYSEDTVPFCSTYIGEPMSTSTVALTARTSAFPYPTTVPIC